MVEFIGNDRQIWCRSCGYQLHGLTQPVCPECGRAFDLANPKTISVRSPEWRRRRRIRRVIALLILVLAAVPFFPRKLLKGEIKFTCSACGVEQTTYRWEPMLPNWTGFRVPAVHWRTKPHRKPENGIQVCTSHAFRNLDVKFDFPVGRAKATYSFGPNETPTLNGQAATPATSMDVLRNLMSPQNMGIGP